MSASDVFGICLVAVLLGVAAGLLTYLMFSSQAASTIQLLNKQLSQVTQERDELISEAKCREWRARAAARLADPKPMSSDIARMFRVQYEDDKS